MTDDSKAIAKLKKKYSKWPSDQKRFDLKKFALNFLPASLVFVILRQFLVKTDYKSKRESTKFFQLANKAYGAVQLRKCDRLLRIAIKLLGSEIPLDYANLLRFATKSTLKDPSKRRELSEQILLATKQLEQSIFDATGWYQLSRGLFSLGYFRAAWFAREISLDLSISESLIPSATSTTLQRGLEAQLERRNFPEVELLMAYSMGRISENFCKEFNDYLDMMQNRYVAMLFSSNSPYSEAVNLCGELITNKSVALVGPGFPRGEYGSEIDSADTVARVKYFGEESLPAQNFHSHRCNIAYQGALESLCEFVIAGRKINFFQNVDLLISDYEVLEFQEKPVMRQDLKLPVFRTTGISGLKLLIQIIKFSPKSLKVFGFDFRIDKVQYSSELRIFYKNDAFLLGHPHPGFNFEKLPPHIISFDFSEHDFVSNFCFAQNLYKAGLFDIEPFGKSILELTPYQYVERLEEMLGDW